MGRTTLVDRADGSLNPGTGIAGGARSVRYFRRVLVLLDDTWVVENAPLFVENVHIHEDVCTYGGLSMRFTYVIEFNYMGSKLRTQVSD